jgi:heme oxygenase
VDIQRFRTPACRDANPHVFECSARYRQRRPPRREMAGTMQTTGLAIVDAHLSVRQMLKQYTALLHHKLDSSPILSSLLKPALSLSDYCRTLNGYALAYESLEDHHGSLELTLGLGQVPAYTPRLPALIHDLDALDQWTNIPRGVPALDRKRCRIRTEWQYWGARYVLEGATQGSKIIAAQLLKHLPQLLPRAFAFWELQLELAQEWTVLCDHLAQRVPKDDAKQQLLDGAQFAFDTFSSCFALTRGNSQNHVTDIPTRWATEYLAGISDSAMGVQLTI